MPDAVGRSQHLLVVQRGENLGTGRLRFVDCRWVGQLNSRNKGSQHPKLGSSEVLRQETREWLLRWR